MALLPADEVDQALQERPEWRRDGASIVLERTFDDFAAALAFVNRVGEVAEARNHHPDLLLHGWNRVRLIVSTHSEGGITALDLELAAAVDAL